MLREFAAGSLFLVTELLAPRSCREYGMISSRGESDWRRASNDAELVGPGVRKEARIQDYRNSPYLVVVTKFVPFPKSDQVHALARKRPKSWPGCKRELKT